ncbi:barstar family protein [Comamonas terrigena]|uniref:barstar family protein n=1 Tax=Comamonas terrigena TaxID=32013 RepID=UPI002353A561|nr:barstar family protein [Comamonas terrigena]
MARAQQVVVTVGDVFKTEELHQRLMTALSFPGFYGRNWDAFWDAITGLVEMPHTLRLEGWQALKAHLPAMPAYSGSAWSACSSSTLHWQRGWSTCNPAHP